MYEHELNFIAEEILKKSKNVKKFKSNILRFFELACKDLYTYYLSIPDKELNILIEEMYKTGEIFIHQQPFYGNISMENMTSLYFEFDIQKTKIKGVQTPLIFGKLYFLKLKHQPEKKFSVRSTGMTSLLNVPYKSNKAYKQGSSAFNNNPIKLGEQEYFNMALLNDHEGQRDFLRHYSSSNDYRTMMLDDLLVTPMQDIKEFSKPDEILDVKSNTTATVKSYLRGMGVDIYHTKSKPEKSSKKSKKKK